jgi:MFS family permease
MRNRARERMKFLFLNIGHFIDHLMTLVFATVAALALSRDWGLSYAELVPYATPGFVAFGLFSLPAGRIADRWSRDGMIVVFFIGIGFAALAASLARNPVEMAVGLFIIGVFAAIYHPVGLAMVVEQATRPGRASRAGFALGLNGVWGNLGVGSAALITGYCIDRGGWRAAFVWPGIVSIVVGIGYWWMIHSNGQGWRNPAASKGAAGPPLTPGFKAALLRLSAIVFFTTAVSSVIFQSTTFALPKIFAERLTGIAGSATLVGQLAFVVFAVASLAQLLVGKLLDVYGPRLVFMAVASIQIVFFLMMPGLQDWPAVLVALAFMLGAFGQIPINDYMVGKMAKSELRASIYGVRYVVGFTSLAAALPLIAWIHRGWGFDMLFKVLAGAAALILLAAIQLPHKLPEMDAPAQP